MINLNPQTLRNDAYWQKLRGQSLFLTGGTGLFGRWFVRDLLEANAQLGTSIKLTILSRKPASILASLPGYYQNSAIDWVAGNVLDFKFPTTQYSQIIHMATTSAHETFAGEASLAKFKMLVDGTEHVMQFAEICGAKKVLFTSSGVVYGAYPSAMQKVAESYQGAPIFTDEASGLAQGKRAAEYIVSAYAQKLGIEFTIARCFSFVGSGLPLDVHYAIGNFIHDALHKEAIIVRGDGSPMRSYLHLGDLISWLLALLVDGKSRQIYNVGSDEAISILDLAYLVRDLISPQKPVIVLGNINHNVGNFGRHWYVPDISLARNELNLDVWMPLKSAILETAQAATNQQLNTI